MPMSVQLMEHKHTYIPIDDRRKAKCSTCHRIVPMHNMRDWVGHRVNTCLACREKSQKVCDKCGTPYPSDCCPKCKHRERHREYQRQNRVTARGGVEKRVKRCPNCKREFAAREGMYYCDPCKTKWGTAEFAHEWEERFSV